MKKIITFIFLAIVELLFLSPIIISDDIIDVDYDNIYNILYSGKKINKQVFNSKKLKDRSKDSYIYYRNLINEYPFKKLLNVTVNSTIEHILLQKYCEYNNHIIAKETNSNAYINLKNLAKNNSLIYFLENILKENLLKGIENIDYKQIIEYYKNNIITKNQVLIIYEYLLKLNAEQPLKKELIKIISEKKTYFKNNFNDSSIEKLKSKFSLLDILNINTENLVNKNRFISNLNITYLVFLKKLNIIKSNYIQLYSENKNISYIYNYTKIFNNYNFDEIYDNIESILSNENIYKIIASTVDNKYGLLSYIDIYSLLIFIASVFMLILAYKYHKYINKKKKYYLKNYLLLTMIFYYTTLILYNNNYLFSSSIAFIYFSFCLKTSLDIIIIHSNIFSYDTFYNIQDSKIKYNIININKLKLNNISTKEYIVKSKLDIIVVLISGSIMSMFILLKLNFVVNYIIFYGIILKFVNITTAYLNILKLEYYQPLIDIIFFLIGIINFSFNNLYLSNEDLVKHCYLVDTLYIMSELFSFITLSSIFNYIKIQAYDINKLELFNYLDNKKINLEEIEYDTRFNYLDITDISSIQLSKLSSLELALDIDKKPAVFVNNSLRDFKLKDIKWILIFILPLYLISMSVKNFNFIAFIFSLHFTKHLFRLLGCVFKIYAIRILKSLYLIYHFLFLSLISEYNDFKLLIAFDINNENLKEVLRLIVYFSGFIYAGYIVIINYEYLYMFNEKIAEMELEKSNECIKQSSKYIKRSLNLNQLSIVDKYKDISIINILYIALDYFLNYLLIATLVYLFNKNSNNLFFNINYDFFLFILLLRVSATMYLYIQIITKYIL